MGALDDARQHLAKAEEFLDAAALAHEAGLSNAASSDAVISGINSKDAICLKLSGRTGKADDHVAAVSEMSRCGKTGAELAPTLQRLLKLKTRSQYQKASVAAQDATNAVAWASKLLEAARSVVNS